MDWLPTIPTISSPENLELAIAVGRALRIKVSQGDTIDFVSGEFMSSLTLNLNQPKRRVLAKQTQAAWWKL
jgi:hypothetical protein